MDPNCPECPTSGSAIVHEGRQQFVDESMAYFTGMLEGLKTVLGFTEANDSTVLTTGRNIDGSQASELDYAAAGIGLFLPISGKLAQETVKEGVTSIFRAVSKAEIDDIATNKLIRPKFGGSENKLFTENVNDAIAQGKAMKKEFNVIQIDVPNSVFEQLNKFDYIDEQIMTGRTIEVTYEKFDLFNKSIDGATVIK